MIGVAAKRGSARRRLSAACSVQQWHPQIHEDESREQLAGFGHGFETVARHLHAVTLVRKVSRVDIEGIVEVVDEENQRSRHVL